MVPIIVFWLGFVFTPLLMAQTETNSASANFGTTNSENSAGIPAPGVIAATPPSAPAATVTPEKANAGVPATPAATAPSLTAAPEKKNPESTGISSSLVLAALLALGSTGGFLLYHCGLTRAKNCGHTSMLLLVGLMFGLVGYWAGGFAVQSGGVGDAHAALGEPFLAADTSGLDHELGFMAGSHHWGLMGSSGFFLTTEHISTNNIAALFLGQFALLAIALAAVLGAALERGRLVAMAVVSFLVGALIYPLFANWVWGGGWLAELGREYGLGHGFVDVAGAGVVHETAGTLALVITMVLGPRYGRFGRDKVPRTLPGHHVPFLVLGALILLMAWTAANAFAGEDPYASSASNSGLAAVNALLGAAAGLVVSFFLAAGRKQRPTPVLLGRGLLAGVVAVSACSSLIDSWAAFLIGALAGLLAHGVATFLERQRIDDPASAVAIHGAGGAWGVVATGFFANGLAGVGTNGVAGPVRGFLFGGAWHQLAAQLIGCVTGFVVVFVLGYACVSLIQKILGLRVDMVDEASGLDWPQIGALGYQGDIEPEEVARSSSEESGKN